MTFVEQSYSPSKLYLRLGVLAIGLFLVATNASVIAGVLPELARDFGVGQEAVGYSITVYAIVVGIAAPVVSITLSRWPRTRLMAAGLVLVAIGTAITAIATNLPVFMLGRGVAALGGAGLVPVATATATVLAPPERRGQAIAIVSLGFTLANAVGSPVGTAVAAAFGWRVPLASVAVLAALTIIPLLTLVRNVPLGEPVPMRQRLAVLRSAPRLWVIAGGLALFAGFNLLYIFSSEATGYTGISLSVLLLVFGIAGVVGNAFAGQITDRFGARRVGTIAFIVQAAALAAVALLPRSFVELAILYGVWGIAAFASTIPLQHRLIDIDHRTAAVALSWYGTATYLGIAVAPIIANVAFAFGNTQLLLPAFGAVLTVLGIVGFLLSWRAGRADEAPTALDDEALPPQSVTEPASTESFSQASVAD